MVLYQLSYTREPKRLAAMQSRAMEPSDYRGTRGRRKITLWASTVFCGNWGDRIGHPAGWVRIGVDGHSLWGCIMNIQFVVIAPKSKAGTFTVRLPIVVGRSEEAKFRIQQDRVSRKHCEFFGTDGQVFVRDLGSTNGTFLDDEQIPTSCKTPVSSGAIVRVGSLAFRVEYATESGMGATKVRPAGRDASDVTVGLKQAGDSEHLHVEHDAEPAADSSVPAQELPEAELLLLSLIHI